MFRLARIKLTAWYLVIIMLISMSFSVVIYRGMTLELNRIEQMQRFRRPIPQMPGIEPEIIEETKQRISFALAFINLLILGVSGAAGYFLAGKTLQPIKEMVDEQRLFISDASHELRTPITSLKSEIEVNLRDKNLTLIDAKQILASNLEDVNGLQNLSDKLIRLTRYEKGLNNFIPTKILLSQIAKHAIKQISTLAKNKKIAINNKIGDIAIEGEKESLTELFVIFLDNAIKYSQEGKSVELKLAKTDNHAVISFIDYGVGIDEADLPHLFDRFYRGDKSRTKSETSGYGLGLAIAKQIIERHHGSIKVKSELNKGTTFMITLPINQHSLRNLI